MYRWTFSHLARRTWHSSIGMRRARTTGPIRWPTRSLSVPLLQPTGWPWRSRREGVRQFGSRRSVIEKGIAPSFVLRVGQWRLVWKQLIGGMVFIYLVVATLKPDRTRERIRIESAVQCRVERQKLRTAVDDAHGTES